MTAELTERLSYLSQEQIKEVLKVYNWPAEGFQPEAAIDAIAKIVGDNLCEQVCMDLEWA